MTGTQIYYSMRLPKKDIVWYDQKGAETDYVPNNIRTNNKKVSFKYRIEISFK